MKKQSLLLITGSILAFASCTQDTANNADETQAKVDSIVNARVDQIRMELEAKNDSLINEMAVYRADSIMAAMTGKAPTVKKPVTKPTGKTTGEDKPVLEEKPKTNPKDARFGGEGDNTTNKDSRFGDDAAKKKAEAEKNKKDDRFK